MKSPKQIKCRNSKRIFPTPHVCEQIVTEVVVLFHQLKI